MAIACAPATDAVPVPRDEGVTGLLDSLGLFQQVANKPRLDARMLDAFAQRQLAFDWIHMGNMALSIDALCRSLRSRPWLRPPRTGHLGNWSDIAAGCSGLRDYNHIICGTARLGYPLLMDYNQTECDETGSGDWMYLPGSLVHGGKRTVLDLFTWDGQDFVRRDRREPYFTPFVLTPVDDDFVPLSQVHRHACVRQGAYDFVFQSDVIIRHEMRVRGVIELLVEDARRKDQPSAMLRRLFDRVVALDGRVSRQSLDVDGAGLRIGERYYPTAADLATDALLLMRAIANPDGFKNDIRAFPPSLPLMSASLFVLILVLTNTHYPDAQTVSTDMTRPCNPHLHWGGISMAGFPPHERGYFSENTRHLRKMFCTLVSHVPDIDPVLFVLLPATIFNLCPHDSNGDDVERVESLLRQVHRETDHLFGQLRDMSTRIETIISDWMSDTGRDMSAYYLARFSSSSRRDFVQPHSPLGHLVFPTGFASLTLQQASMVTGALDRIVRAGSTLPMRAAE